jgi:hypothetical protein
MRVSRFSFIKEDGMHRISTKRLLAFIVSLGACLALTASPALDSAQGTAVKAAAPGSSTVNASAPKISRVGKQPAAKAAPKAKKQKRTSGASQLSVSGTVTDGSGHGWPLYARLDFTSGSTEPLSVFTDPVTGQYQGLLFDGIDYTVAVTALSPGYTSAGTTFTTSGSPVIQDWSLTVDAVACSAPGYSPAPNGLSEHFSSGSLPDGWTVVNDSSDGPFPGWFINSGADPCGEFTGNDTGGSGPYALVDSNCDGFETTIDSSLVSPSVDLSSLGTVTLLFNQEYVNLGDNADVDISTDGGDTWQNVLAQTESVFGPNAQTFDVSSIAAGHATVQVRFHNYNANFAWWWQVDDVVLGPPTCAPNPGGLVVGTVEDGNTGNGINGATVSDLTQGTSATTADTSDPAQGSGFYELFAPAGPQSFQATKSGYASDSQNATVFNNDVVRRDFTLQAGMLSAAPSPLSAVIPASGMSNQSLTLTNSGEPPASFEILQFNSPLLVSQTEGFVSKQVRDHALARLPKDAQGKPRVAAFTAVGLPALTGGPALHGTPRTLDATVLGTFPSDIAYGWGVATSGIDVWLSNISIAGGDDKDYQYSGGSLTGGTIDDKPAISAWAGDGAYNSNTGTFWRVDVVAAGSSCIFELDPVSKKVTGNRICPATGASERGLAYDPTTDTYFAASFNDGVVNHFDSTGTILDSVFVALPISGLAYNANNGHLLAMLSQAGTGNEIAVLDALNDYATLGFITVPGMTAGGGAGMEFDCLGNLWVQDQLAQVLIELATDESPQVCSGSIPWLTVSPTGGTVPGAGDGAVAGEMSVNATFNSTGLLPGLRQAQIQIASDTPYAVPGIPVDLTVLFNDVPQGSFAWNFIYGVAGAGIMFGGPPVCTNVFSFCPNGFVTRADMAGYLFRALHGVNAPPPVYQNTFADVSFNDYNAFYIQGIFDDGLTAGCNTDPLIYCPNVPVTRAQMSVLVWKDQHGSTAPPACTGVFADVPCPDGFAVDYIEGLFNEGVTAGCGGGNFCPNTPITNAQMSVFLVNGFNVPFLP